MTHIANPRASSKLNTVFIATSLDGFIADREGGLDWLHQTPNPNEDDMGYGALVARIDALVMGRNTFETVAGFDCDWPYSKPVCVLSNSLKAVPKGYENKIFILSGEPKVVLEQLYEKGFNNLYLDGGKTIQAFLREDLVDELIINQIPIVLGGGTPLFGELMSPLDFTLASSTVFLDALVQNHFIRNRDNI